MAQVKVIEVDTHSDLHFPQNLNTSDHLSDDMTVKSVNFNDQDITETIRKEIAEKHALNDDEEIVYFQINAKISYIIKPKSD